ncbi:calcium-binding protein [Synechococcus sp. PCC 7335]|uniref:calcium-binding protein n=1 Tax=Synechococcus sp. (strain ATCC 29403 / PCC 7335) TaxID=91464 RepID=UPI001D0D2102|nr:calcium-binding protein [Synechococcus sp. PCC 7335]
MVSPIKNQFQLEDLSPDLFPAPSKFVAEPPFVGGYGNDTIIGDENNNVIKGNAGDDFILGVEGTDVIYGGKGNDTIAFDIAGMLSDSFSRGVYANLSKQEAIDPCYNREKIYSIENVIGTYKADELIGDFRPNELAGSDGNDKLLGKGGNDFLYGGRGPDFMIGGSGSDQYAYLDKSEGSDRIEGFKSGVDQIMIRGSWFLPGHPSSYSLGQLPSGQFFLGSAAEIDRQLFGFNPATNQVLYDSNGAGPGGVFVIATLTGSRGGIVASDIEIF